MSQLAVTEYNYSTSYEAPSSYDSDSQLSAAASTAVFGVMAIIFTLVALVMVISSWKIFKKAGRPGWAAIVPIYNMYVMLGIVGRPAWWLLLYFVPIASVIVPILIALDMARAFGKSTTFAIFGLILFPLVGYPMLAFGPATYAGAKPIDLTGSTPTTPPATPQAGQTPPPAPPTPPTAPTA